MPDGRDEQGASGRRPHPPASRTDCNLRRYLPRDDDAATQLWLRSWQAAYPHLDFAERIDWWRARWRDTLVPSADIVIAEAGGTIAGFVTVDPRTGYLDQIVVAPESWGTGIGAALIDAAKTISPNGLDLDVNVDNARAVRFYEKYGFTVTGSGANPNSGKPVHRMSWRP